MPALAADFPAMLDRPGRMVGSTGYSSEKAGLTNIQTINTNEKLPGTYAGEQF
jgi:hypothetical protein